ncbi:MAG TPA: hypothetical protein VI731_07260 [Bacteroidia bacterium]|nr:hypothetical protein [Bacteroidia bacterium]
MKKCSRFLSILVCIGFLAGSTGCLVVKHDNGKHKGWYKNSNNGKSSAAKSTPAGKSTSSNGKSNGNGKAK